MPLHDWTDDRGWDGVQLLWFNDLINWIQPRLPAGFGAYVGSLPALTIDSSNGRPDVTVRQWSPEPIQPASTSGTVVAPDLEAFVTFELDPHKAIHIDWKGQLIAAIELVSPRNKDRPDSRTCYLGRFAGYLRQGVHLLLVDVLPRPKGFSFADAIAMDLGMALEPTPAPYAVSFRVGEPVPGGTIMAWWRRPLQVRQPLAVIPLALNVNEAIDIDLEQTYQQAAKRAYLD